MTTYTAAFVAILASIASVSSALACWLLWKQVRKTPGTASLRAEVAELHDAFSKNTALLKRVNMRAAMQERRDAAGNGFDVSDPQQQPGESTGDWKKRARRLLVTPGQPARHR